MYGESLERPGSRDPAAFSPGCRPDPAGLDRGSHARARARLVPARYPPRVLTRAGLATTLVL